MSVVFLGVIAVATLAMAIVQIGVIVAAGRLARRVDRLADQVERDLRPMVDHLNAIARDASRAAAVAAGQVDRVDRLFADLGNRIELTLNALQASLEVPAREGRAVLAALGAALGALREGAHRAARSRPGRADDDDALFI
jgi:hypothetical protein